MWSVTGKSSVITGVPLIPIPSHAKKFKTLKYFRSKINMSTKLKTTATKRTGNGFEDTYILGNGFDIHTGQNTAVALHQRKNSERCSVFNFHSHMVPHIIETNKNNH